MRHGRMPIRSVLIAGATFSLLLTACDGGSSVEDESDPTVTSTSSPARTTVTAGPPTTTLPPPTTTSTTLPPAPCEYADLEPSDGMGSGNLTERIMARGAVRVGVLPADATPFFFCDDGTYAGFEASISRLLVARAFGDLDIQWVPVSSADRLTVVQDGIVDFAMRSTTVTPDRAAEVDFTAPYLMDGVAVIVPADAGIGDVTGLEGVRIAVLGGTTLESDLTAAMGDAGVSFEPVQAGSPEELPTLVYDGDADAYAALWSLAVQIAGQDPRFVVVPVEFQSVVAGYSSEDDADFAATLDEQVMDLLDSGAWESEFQSAFGFPPPWTIEEMLGAG